MKAKPILLLVVALGCGLVAMLGVQQVMSSPSESDERPSVEEVTVMQATAEIKPFGVLDESNTKLVTVPKSAVENTEGVVTSYEEVIDRKIRTGAVKGEYILTSKLVDKAFKPSAMIPKGMRVVTVKVNQTTAHSGLMQAGDRVDIILTMKTTKLEDDQRSGGSKFLVRKDIQQTVTVLQNVEVFATDNFTQSIAKDQEGTETQVKNVSVLVEPKNANILMLAEKRGTLTLSLRAFEDDTNSTVSPINDEQLLGLGRGNFQKTKKKQDDYNQGAKDPNNLENYLNSKDGKTANDNRDPKNKSGEYEWVRPKWKLVIFTGKTPRTEQVEDPNAKKIRVKVNRSNNDSNSTTNTGQSNTGETQPKRATSEQPQRKVVEPPMQLK